MTTLLTFLVLIPSCLGADLAYSTFLSGGFTPSSIASDAQGNIYMVGSIIATQRNVAAKVEAQSGRYVYFTDLGSAATDWVTAIAVDVAGRAYITGDTSDSRFPVTASPFATAPAGDGTDRRSFLMEINTDGSTALTVLFGGSTSNYAQGIALTPQAQILISGYSFADGFPATPGAYKVSSSKGRAFLMELDSAATKMVFSATGIGGSSIALDAASNIYLAGNSDVNYPATPLAFQPSITGFYFCGGMCMFGSVEYGLHLTKIDPTASTLIYSTGLPLIGLVPSQGGTLQHLLAVDSDGNAYVSGSPTALSLPPAYTNMLMKLDPAGSIAVYSIPAGGRGVQIDSAGSVFAAGVVPGVQETGSGPPVIPTPPPQAFSGVPQACWPNNVVATRGAYIVKLDPATGVVQDGQWIDGSAPSITDMILAGGKVWMAGSTPAPDVPYTPGAVAPAGIAPGLLQGGFLTSADFSQSTAGPSIACALDQGNMTHVGAIAPGQLISLFGANLGTDANSVSVTFDGTPATLLYVSPSQVNIAVPSLSSTATVMQFTVNGASAMRQFPVTASNLNLFADLSKATSCGDSASGQGFQPLLANADGTLNSCANPAKLGSTVTLYAHGAGAAFSAQSLEVDLQHPCTNAVDQAAIVGAGPFNSYVDKVDILLGSSFSSCGPTGNQVSSQGMTVSYAGKIAGPFTLPSSVNYAYGHTELPMTVWVKP